jgi:hypothetical protein
VWIAKGTPKTPEEKAREIEKEASAAARLKNDPLLKLETGIASAVKAIPGMLLPSPEDMDRTAQQKVEARQRREREWAQYEARRAAKGR